MYILQYTVSLRGAVGHGYTAALHGAVSHWPSIHYPTARVQGAVKLLQYTATLQGARGRGQWGYFNTPPHCTGQWAVWMWCGVVWCGVPKALLLKAMAMMLHMGKRKTGGTRSVTLNLTVCLVCWVPTALCGVRKALFPKGNGRDVLHTGKHKTGGP